MEHEEKFFNLSVFHNLLQNRSWDVKKKLIENVAKGPRIRSMEDGLPGQVAD